ncbi:MAG: phosphatase PAP2 family protein [Sphingomonadales bacterium]|nr:phosphatase PAP2 family protein [Sphingomonadales bacterium]
MNSVALALFKREARLIVALVVVAIALLLVIQLGSEIREDGTFGFDRWMMLALRQPDNLSVPIGPGWLRQVLVDITALGGVTALTLVTTAVVGYLVTAGRFATAGLLAAATISGSVLGHVLKLTFVRARPTIVPHFVDVNTLSYPSGHAMNSAVLFLTLGTLLARAERTRRRRIYILSVAILFTLLVGFSRVYVGVHWPTDIIAGWAVGGSWALLWWAIMLRLQQSQHLTERESIGDTADARSKSQLRPVADPLLAEDCDDAATMGRSPGM